MPHRINVMIYAFVLDGRLSNGTGTDQRGTAYRRSSDWCGPDKAKGAWSGFYDMRSRAVVHRDYLVSVRSGRGSANIALNLTIYTFSVSSLRQPSAFMGIGQSGFFR